MRPTLGEILSDKKNQIAFDALCAMLQTPGRRPMALVGAGLSARAGYPGWNALLDGIHDELMHTPSEPGEPRREPSETLRGIDDVLWRAEAYAGLMGIERFRASLGRSFGPREWADRTLETVVRLPFGHVFTTNYDPTLQEAHLRAFGQPARYVNWAHPASVTHFMARATDPAFERHYVHLHGRYDKPESMVLRDSDYVQQYVQSDATVKKLFALFATQRFVFLGFSLNDADLMAILRDATVHTRGEDPRHVAIIPTRPAPDTGKPVDWAVHRERYVTKFGIAPVFYDTSQGFEGFAVLVEALARRCNCLPEDAEPLVNRGGFEFAPRSAPEAELRDEAALGTETGVDESPFGAGTERDEIDVSQMAPRPRPARVTRKKKKAPPPIDPEDPHRGQFGGSDTAGDMLLAARVTTTEQNDDWFAVHLEVRPRAGEPPVRGSATFHLHPTFRPDEVTVAAVDGRVTLDLMSYGAFTVGVRMDDGTELELNLADDPAAPMAFRMR